MKEERSGLLDKEKQNYLRKNKNINEYQGNHELAEENIYDIKEQKRLLEELERKKKKEKEAINNFYLRDEQSNMSNKKNKFILDDKTVNKNRLIICNIQNLFDSDNEEDEFNINDFSWDNNTYNKSQINNSYKNKIQVNTENHFSNNVSINLNQINNNVNNNIHNQQIINQFFDFTKNKINNNPVQQNPNFKYLNGNYNNNKNNKYDDDFNPFLD